MEFKNNKVIKGFVNDQERSEIINFIDTINFKSNPKNVHISEVASHLNGNSYMFDITKTEVSKYLSKFQSSDNLCDISLPNIFYKLVVRISKSLDIPTDNVFLQILDQDCGGKIVAHYDTSIDGYINYKCNISILSDDYTLYVDKSKIDVSCGDLYAFEASLYKHWTDEFKSRRIILSYGFGLTYEQLGRVESDPRVRLSKRIERYFQ